MVTRVLLSLGPIQAEDGGLTFDEVVEALPTDPASIFALLLLAGFFGLIVYLGVVRRGSSGAEDADGRSDEKPEGRGKPFSRTGK
jgi:hypothetical protein